MASSRGRSGGQLLEHPPESAVGGTDGLLLWVTPMGPRREVAQSSLADPHPGSTECDQCGADDYLETVVREHRRCGYVAFDGMAGPDGMRHTCPKCDATDSVGFPVVTTIWTCRTCGHPIDDVE